MKKIIGLGAIGLVVPAAIASTALASVALFAPAVAGAAPATGASANVVGEPYFKAVSILKSQGLRASFGGSFGSDLPQSQCIVSQQKALKSRMILMLDCTAAAGKDAAGDAPAPSAPAAGTPGSGQGTYGGPIGVPVPVG
ncbi:hypothetical protein H7K45_05825 [Mycobacterium yunnanensis]|uniref:PASTA domain-containing protein n=1 Tax=Mycobacterium yunnanensis TaxID=368477 RepID=A0A9X3BSH0_9MYCO|nr:hypothetical protein [Mycobacterium yunnanensis]MCV7420050.1 hypothetical protein [Mycobacterium yunnanensis]